MTLRIFLDDLSTYKKGKLGFGSIIRLLVTQPGVRCVFLYRVLSFFQAKGVPLLPALMRLRILRKYGADFVPGSVIGPGLNIQHPQGIVVGQGVRIGSNCTILQNVTFGEKLSNVKGSYPTIGDNCTFGSGAVVIGDVTLGENVFVGANAVVTKSFGPNSIIAGIPAKLLEL